MTIVPIVGEYDYSSSSDFEELLVNALALGKLVVLDMRKADYLDSACLSVLVRQWAKNQGRFRVLAPPASTVRRILDITGLDVHLQVVHDLRDLWPLRGGLQRFALALAPQRLERCNVQRRSDSKELQRGASYKKPSSCGEVGATGRPIALPA
jgi:anti-anti-sigma factor